MNPQIREVAEKKDGSFMFTAEDLDQPGVLYGFDNVRLVQKEGTNEVYLEYETVASIDKELTLTEAEVQRNAVILLNQIWSKFKPHD